MAVMDIARRSTSRLAALAIAATVLCRMPTFLRPVLDPDEATFASVAALMNTGGRLYAEGGVDNKFPAIYWTYAAVFRVFGRYAMGAVHALELAVVLATAALVALAARRLVRERQGDGARAGWLAFAFYGVYSSVYYPKMIAANTEIFMVLPLAAAFLLTLVSRDRGIGSSQRLLALLVAGALVGAGCAYKQVAIVTLPLIALAALVDRGRSAVSRLLGALVPIAGCAVTLGAMAAWLTHEGTRAAWWQWTVARLLSHYGPSAWRSGDYLGAAVTTSLPFAACAIALVAASGAMVLRARSTSAGERLALAWLGLSAIGVAAGGRFFGHYFLQVVGPLAVIGAVEIDRRLTRRIAIATLLLTAINAIGFATLAALSDPITQRPGGAPPGYDDLAAWVRAHSTSDERVFVWGLAGPFYLSADRVPATRFVGFLRGLHRDRDEPPEHSWDAGPDVWPILLEDLAAHPPALVIATAPADYFNFRGYPIARFPTLAAWLDAGYLRATTIGGVDVYRRR